MSDAASRDRENLQAGRPGAGSGDATVRIGTVTFEGAFEEAERSYLASEFGSCRLDLVARSTSDPHVSLVRWQADSAPGPRRGPSPLFAPPQRAYYVLSMAGGAAVTAARWRDPAMHLERIDDSGTLATRYPGHFPEGLIERSWHERVRGAWRRVLRG
jgi:hypothetical protein